MPGTSFQQILNKTWLETTRKVAGTSQRHLLHKKETEREFWFLSCSGLFLRGGRVMVGWLVLKSYWKALSSETWHKWRKFRGVWIRFWHAVDQGWHHKRDGSRQFRTKSTLMNRKSLETPCKCLLYSIRHKVRPARRDGGWIMQSEQKAVKATTAAGSKIRSEQNQICKPRDTYLIIAR